MYLRPLRLQSYNIPNFNDKHKCNENQVTILLQEMIYFQCNASNNNPTQYAFKTRIWDTDKCSHILYETYVTKCTSIFAAYKQFSFDPRTDIKKRWTTIKFFVRLHQLTYLFLFFGVDFRVKIIIGFDLIIWQKSDDLLSLLCIIIIMVFTAEILLWALLEDLLTSITVNWLIER